MSAARARARARPPARNRGAARPRGRAAARLPLALEALATARPPLPRLSAMPKPPVPPASLFQTSVEGADPRMIDFYYPRTSLSAAASWRLASDREGEWVTLSVNADDVRLCWTLVESTIKYWDFAFMAGVGFALRGAHGDPSLSLEKRSDSSLARAAVPERVGRLEGGDGVLVDAVWKALAAARAARDDVGALVKTMLVTMFARTRMAESDWHRQCVALRKRFKDNEEDADFEWANEQLDDIARKLLEDEHLHIPLIKELLDEHTSEETLARAGFLADAPCSISKILELLLEIEKAASPDGWTLPASKKMETIHSYLHNEKIFCMHLFDPALWANTTMQPFLREYKRAVEEHASKGEYTLAPADGTANAYMVLHNDKPVRFYDKRLCDEMGMHDMPVDDYYRLGIRHTHPELQDEEERIAREVLLTDRAKIVEAIVDRRMLLAAHLHISSIALAQSAALATAFPEIPHEEYVTKLAGTFECVRKTQCEEAITAADAEQKPADRLNADDLVRSSVGVVNTALQGEMSSRVLDHVYNEVREAHYNGVTFEEGIAIAEKAKSDAEAAEAATAPKPPKGPMDIRDFFKKKSAPAPPKPPPKPPPPPPPEPPPPPKPLKPPEIGFVSVDAAGGCDKVFGLYRDPAHNIVWEALNPEEQRSPQWTACNGWPVMVTQLAPASKGAHAQNVCLLFREAPGGAICLVSRDNNRINIPLDWKITEEQLNEEPKKKQPGKKARRKAREAEAAEAAAAAAAPAQEKEEDSKALLATIRKLEREKEEQRKAAEAAKQAQDALKDALHKAKRQEAAALNEARDAYLEVAGLAEASSAAAAAAAAADAQDEAALCVVCMDKPKQWAVVPCYHRCLCEDCCEQILAAPAPKCPMCNTTAKGERAIRIFDA